MRRKGTIVLCMGSSCFARGNNINLRIVKDFLRTNNMEDKIELLGSRCEGCCSDGPNITVDGELYHEVGAGCLLEILERHFLSDGRADHGE